MEDNRCNTESYFHILGTVKIRRNILKTIKLLVFQLLCETNLVVLELVNSKNLSITLALILISTNNYHNYEHYDYTYSGYY